MLSWHVRWNPKKTNFRARERGKNLSDEEKYLHRKQEITQIQLHSFPTQQAPLCTTVWIVCVWSTTKHEGWFLSAIAEIFLTHIERDMIKESINSPERKISHIHTVTRRHSSVGFRYQNSAREKKSILFSINHDLLISSYADESSHTFSGPKHKRWNMNIWGIVRNVGKNLRQ